MRRPILDASLAALIVGCSPVIPSDGAENDDTSTPEWVTDTAGDTAVPDSPQEADLSVWDGSRRFSIDARWDDYDCEEEITESGEAVADTELLALLMAACHQCTHFYEIRLSTYMLCEYLPLNQSPWRGVHIDGSDAEVFRLHKRHRGDFIAEVLDEEATFSGNSIHYGYTRTDDWIDSLEVVGEIRFPALSE